jgi:hypothetical protein
VEARNLPAGIVLLDNKRQSMKPVATETHEAQTITEVRGKVYPALGCRLLRSKDMKCEYLNFQEDGDNT